MHGLRQDIRYAFRGFIKRPAFTLSAVATLALGIGANTAIFTLINGLMFKPLPFAAPDQLMMVHLLAPDREGGPGLRELGWPYPKYEVSGRRHRHRLGLSLAGMRFPETLLYQVKPNDPVTLLVPAAGLFAIALVAG
jgi:hypothetical protein